jgi:hypothetical protein
VLDSVNSNKNDEEERGKRVRGEESAAYFSRMADGTSSTSLAPLWAGEKLWSMFTIVFFIVLLAWQRGKMNNLDTEALHW